MLVCSRLIAGTLLLAVAAGTTGAAEPQPRFSQRWVWVMANLGVDKQADFVTGLIERAARAGYNGLVLNDYKLNVLARMGPGYFKNVARARAAAARHHIEIIPCVFPIGYSEGLLTHDANLAEGLPVKDAPFVVKGREAVPIADPAARLRNGDFEEAKGNRFPGFSFQDDPGKVTFADREVVHGGKVACRLQDIKQGSTGNGRVAQRVKLRPYACYRLACWVKTRDFRPSTFKLLALGKRPLNFHEVRLQPTQDWTLVETAFNSLDQSDVGIYAGQWGGGSGTLWIDDLALEELALVNVLRRDGCPLTVTDAAGRTVYEEGKDFEPVRDPALSRVPFAGGYNFGHAGATLRLTEGSRLKDGERLRVSWYHPVKTHAEQVMCCLTEPKVYDRLRDQARRVNDLYQPKTFLMGFDEIRVANWCKACQDTGKSPGQLLAASAHRCLAILKEVNPQARVVTWSDMFDPNHNAVNRYYLVNGPLEGSWQGLSKDVIIANWNGGKKTASLKWFADHGHTQVIAGYYDRDISSFRTWATAAQGVPGVTGFMYTTWQRRYDDLEAFGKAMLGKDNP
jgi:hypothetical protein